ncbi:MAG: hypothetical protein RLZZ91_1552 [Bacteroidota bacterium]|jgi:hypothetical protein
MKTKQNIFKAIATVALGFGAFASMQAQSNLGAACGCPPVASRPEIVVSTLPGYTAISGTYGGELTSGASFTCQNTYILDKKIYIPNGQALSIQPGTVIKGAANTIPAEATALVIERGGKLLAAGTESCPIVFTAAADPMDGSYAISNIGKWGGLVILGRATNNLTLAANGPYVPGGAGKLAVADGLGTIEGFATSNTQDQYGVNLSAGETFNDDDNSGVLKYVSIRHSGAILSVGAEINGLTLGSVGRGTTIDHLEIVSCADDNIEFFGGTVNLKYVTTLFGNDDMYDWDCGYKGKMQFVFGMKSDATSSPDNDSGIEADADDNKSNLLPRSHPVIYNATFMGNGKATNTADNTGLAGITAKELTEGEIYNSVFANFKNGLWLQKSISGARSYATGGEAWHNWSNIAGPASATAGNGSQSLKVVCNTFVGVTNALTNGSTPIAAGTVDYIQFDDTDMNDIVSAIPGFDYSFALNTTTNVFSQKNDVTPNPALSITGCPTAPADGFFEPANYRGAFSSVNGENWLSNWSYSHVLNATTGVRACATDLNLDGVTDVNDFLIFAPAFGTSCN